MNRNTMTKAGALAGLALLALLAVPNTSAELNRIDVARLCVTDEHAETNLHTDLALAPDLEIRPVFAVDKDGVCRLVANVPAGVCSYTYTEDYEEISCLVAVDGLGVCYGWYHYHNYDTGDTETSCYQRVGL